VKGLFTKTNIAIGLAVALLAAVLIAATTGGITKDSVPGDDVAVVDGNGITNDQFAAAMKQSALQQGLQAAPNPGDPQYDTIRDAALGDLFDIAWIQGEAKDQGVEVTDTAIQQQFQQTKKQNFKTEAEYQKFLQTSGFTEADVLLRVKLQLLSQKIQDKISENVPKVSDQEVQDFYNQNKKQFEQPATRDIRFVLNKDKAKAEEAKKQLDADPSDANWKKVAAEFSTDAATKDNGGVQQGVTQGTLPPVADKAVFAAPVGQISDPIGTTQGYYVVEVTKENEATTQALDQVKSQLLQQLQQQKQQEVFTAFITDYRSKWADVTICAKGFIIDRCDNYVTSPLNTQCSGQQATPGQPKPDGTCPVGSRAPVAPGQAGAGSLGGSTGGAPQGPHPAGAGEAAPTGLPPGLSTGGAGATGTATPGQ
jgi:parvulin-like peptidyl-prolyl isomerase